MATNIKRYQTTEFKGGAELKYPRVHNVAGTSNLPSDAKVGTMAWNTADNCLYICYATSPSVAWKKMGTGGAVVEPDGTSAGIAVTTSGPDTNGVTTYKVKASGITNSHISSSAGIAWSKLAAGTANQIMVTNGSGVPTTLGVLNVARGGTGTSSYTVGDMLYATGVSTLSKLGIGSEGEILRSNGSAPGWSSLADAGIASAGHTHAKYDEMPVYFATCDTAAATTTKVATCSDNRKLTSVTKGTIVFVTFTTTNSGAVGSLRLKIDDTADYPLKQFYNSGVANLNAVAQLYANQTVRFIFDGTNWVGLFNYNNTYSLVSDAELQNSASTNARLISGQRFAAALTASLITLPTSDTAGRLLLSGVGTSKATWLGVGTTDYVLVQGANGPGWQEKAPKAVNADNAANVSIGTTTAALYVTGVLTSASGNSVIYKDTSVSVTGGKISATDIDLAGNIRLYGANRDTYITFDHTNAYDWRIGYLGSGDGDANYFVIQTTGAGSTFANALQMGCTTKTSTFFGNVVPNVTNTLELGSSSLLWKNVYATNLRGNLIGGTISGTTLTANSTVTFSGITTSGVMTIASGVVSSVAVVPVNKGGIGTNTLANNEILIGKGTNNVQSISLSNVEANSLLKYDGNGAYSWMSASDLVGDYLPLAGGVMGFVNGSLGKGPVSFDITETQGLYTGISFGRAGEINGTNTLILLTPIAPASLSYGDTYCQIRVHIAQTNMGGRSSTVYIGLYLSNNPAGINTSYSSWSVVGALDVTSVSFCEHEQADVVHAKQTSGYAFKIQLPETASYQFNVDVWCNNLGHRDGNFVKEMTGQPASDNWDSYPNGVLYGWNFATTLSATFTNLPIRNEPYLRTSGGTMDSSASIKWTSQGGKTPYIGYGGQTDGTFVIASITGTAYNTGLAIGGTSGNLLWKGQRVLDASNYTDYVKNGNLYLQASGTTKTTFTANQSGNSTFNIATGSANGTISVHGTDVAVKGLKSNAYTDTAFLPLAGGTMTGQLKWEGSTALPAITSPQYILAIDAFADGGATKYVTIANLGTAIGLGNYLPLSGGTITGALTVQGAVTLSGVSTTAGILHKAADGTISSGLVDINTETTGTLTVARGGTGATTFTANRLLVGNGTSAIAVLGVATSGYILYGNSSNNPTWVSRTSAGLAFATGVSSSTAAAAGWYRIAQSSSGIEKCFGLFRLHTTTSGIHNVMLFTAGCSFGATSSVNITQLSNTSYSASGITKIRIVYTPTYTNNRAYLEVYDATTAALAVQVRMIEGLGWSLVAPSTAGGIPTSPTDYTSKELVLSRMAIVGESVIGTNLTASGAVKFTGFTTAGVLHNAADGTVSSSKVSLADDVSGTLAVSKGGTGATSTTAYRVVAANSSANAYTVLGEATSNYVLVGNGGSALPTWQEKAPLANKVTTTADTTNTLYLVGVVTGSTTTLKFDTSVTVAGSVLTSGTHAVKKIFLETTETDKAHGLHFYGVRTLGRNDWQMYMAQAGQGSCSVTGRVTAPTGTGVTNFAIRSLVSDRAGNGWTWEKCSTTANTDVTPTIVAELSNSGTFIASGITASTTLKAGTLSGALYGDSGTVKASSTTATELGYVHGVTSAIQTQLNNKVTRGRVYNNTTNTTWLGTIPLWVLSLKNGYPTYTDTEFSSGNNSVNIYNNTSGSTGVVIERVDASGESALGNYGSGNASGKVLRVTLKGGSSPGYGGFYQQMTAAANKQLVQIFRALLPVGYKFVVASNNMGAGYKDEYLTNPEGTGKWEWYARTTYCGAGTTYSTGGHNSITRISESYPAPTTDAPIVFYIAECNCYDITRGTYAGLRVRYADSSSYASTTADTTNTLFLVGVATGATSTLKHDTSVTVKGGLLTASTGAIGKVFLETSSSSWGRGISFWGASSSNRNDWQMYIGLAGTSGAGVFGKVTPPSGTNVTTYAIRSIVSEYSGSGWTWESVPNGTTSAVTPTLRAELSNTGIFKATGGFVGDLTGTASNVTTTNDNTNLLYLVGVRSTDGTALYNTSGVTVTGTALSAGSVSASGNISATGDLKAGGNVRIGPCNDTNHYLYFDYQTTNVYSWRIGYEGTGSGNSNYLTIESGNSSGTTWNKVLYFGLTDKAAYHTGAVMPNANNTLNIGSSSVKWANVYATKFNGEATNVTTTADTTNTLYLVGVTSTGTTALKHDTSVTVTGGALITTTAKIGGSSGAILKYADSTLQVRNSADSDWGAVKVGNLTVEGTITYINTQDLNVADNIITLNSDVTGTPSENAGIEIKRGTSTNASLIWDEANDVWKAGLAGSEKTLAFADLSNISGTLPVNRGGTGTTTFTANGVLYGNGTSAIQATGSGTSGYLLVSGGANSAPSWKAIGDITHTHSEYINKDGSVSFTAPWGKWNSSYQGVYRDLIVKNYSGTDSFTGCIKIKIGGTGAAMRLIRIMLYSYKAGSTSGEILVAGYTFTRGTNGASKSWENPSVYKSTNNIPTVRLTTDGSYYYILIGAVDTTWRFNWQIAIDELTGYSGNTASERTDWTVELITTEPTWTQTVTPTVNGGLNADMVDGKHVGVASGNIAVLGAGGVFDAARIPVMDVAHGGIGITSYTSGDILYAVGATSLSTLGIGSNGYVLKSDGTKPVWSVISDIVTSANPTGTIGLTTVNGSASTYMRSDAAPALSTAIVPTWSGKHTFGAGLVVQNTNSDATKGLTIRRHTTDAEMVQHYLDDTRYYLKYTNDEKSNSFYFQLINTDLGDGGDGTGANTSTVSFAGSSSGSNVTATKFTGSLVGGTISGTTLTASSTVKFTGISTTAGVLHKAADGTVSSSAISMTTDVSGVLPMANGGLGTTTLTQYAVLLGNGTGIISATSVGTDNYVLIAKGSSAFPTWAEKAPKASQADKWTTGRTLTIGGTGKTVDGSGNVSWSQNEIGYASGKTTSATTAATAGWYRIASTPANGDRSIALFRMYDATGSRHGACIFTASISYAQDPQITQIAFSKYNANTFNKLRIVYHTTYSGHVAYLEYYNNAATALAVYVEMVAGNGWSLIAPNTAGSVPDGYKTLELTLVPGGTANTGSMVSPTGVLGKIFLETTSTNKARGLSFWQVSTSGRPDWQMYMANAGTTGAGVNGYITAPSGTYVTSYAIRSVVQDTSNYGWTWEKCGSGTTNAAVTPTIVAELRNDGIFKAAGFVGAGTSITNLNASNLASGTVNISRLPTGTGSTQVALGNHTHAAGTITGVYHDKVALNTSAYSSGSLYLIDRNLVDVARANRMAFISGDSVSISFSSDGGSTWTDAGYTTAQKAALFSARRAGSIRIGATSGTVTTNHQTKIEITLPSSRYCTMSQFYIWMSTPHTVKLDAYVSTYGAQTTFSSLFTDRQVSGWGGPNMLSFASKSFWGTNASSHIYTLRFIFKITGVNSSYTTSWPSVNDIRGYGASCWSNGNYLMYHDHIYTWDDSQNVTFPAQLKAPTLSITGAGTIAGATTLSSTLSVAGASTLTGTVTMSGNASVGGILTLKANQYTDTANTGVLNLQNSDIYGVNSIKFADKADGPGEALQWYRDSTHVDSVWVQDGVMYITPNRAWGGTGTNYPFLNSGNYTTYVKDGTLNLQASGTTKVTFKANQSSDATFNIGTGSSNGTISVGGADVAVKGLGSNAYTSDSYALSTHTQAVNKGGTNITSYTIGDMIYASAATTLAKLAIGTSGYVLKSDGTKPVWVAKAPNAAYADEAGTASSAASADSVAWANVSSKPATATRWPAWSEVTDKPNRAGSSSDGGSATTVVSSGVTSSNTYYITGVTAANGTHYYCTGISFNASTKKITATGFVGALTGNADTADAWKTGRTITLSGGVTGTSSAWTGSGNLTITTTLSSHEHGAGDITSGTLTVPYGGIGTTTLTAHGVLVGNGTSNVNATATGTAGDVLISGGSSADPSWKTLANAGIASTGHTHKYAGSSSAGGSATTVVSSGVTSSNTYYITGVTAANGTQYYCTGISFNASTKKITATGFVGALTGNADTATSAGKLTNSKNFSITGGATAADVAFNGESDVALNVTSLDATKLSGTVAIGNLPTGTGSNQVALGNHTHSGYASSTHTQAVNKGGTNITSYTIGDMLYASAATTLAKLGIGTSEYVLKSDGTKPVWVAKAPNAAYADEAGTATSASSADAVAWSGVTGKPSSYTPSAHATNATTYGASSSTNYGHAKASSTTPIVAGVASTGSETSSFARGDHVHPAQTSVSGNAGTVTSTGVTSNNTYYITGVTAANGTHYYCTGVSFNASTKKITATGFVGNVEGDCSGTAGGVAWSNVTGKPSAYPPEDHTQAVTKGGTGLTSIAAYAIPYASAANTFGTIAIGSTAGYVLAINSDKTGYAWVSRLSSVTAHASTATTYGASSADNYGHAKASSTSPKAHGTAAVGSETSSFARGDHVHPAQTSVTGSSGSCAGNAASATQPKVTGLSKTGTTAYYITGVQTWSSDATARTLTSCYNATVDGKGNMVVGGSLTVTGLGTIAGVVHNNTSGVLSSSLVSLTADVSGILPVANGGIGISSIAAYAIPYASAANTFGTISIGSTAGYVLAINSDKTGYTWVSRLSSVTSHASTSTTYGASSADNYGHAKASSTSPKAHGTAAVGSETSSFARGDHVHPAQTSVSGNAGSATELKVLTNTTSNVYFTGVTTIDGTNTARAHVGMANVYAKNGALTASSLALTGLNAVGVMYISDTNGSVNKLSPGTNDGGKVLAVKSDRSGFEFVTMSGGGGGASNLSELGDVSISSPVIGQLLWFNGTKWAQATAPTTSQNGYVLKVTVSNSAISSLGWTNSISSATTSTNGTVTGQANTGTTVHYLTGVQTFSTGASGRPLRSTQLVTWTGAGALTAVSMKLTGITSLGVAITDANGNISNKPYTSAEAGKFLKVNSSGTGLEWGTASGGGSDGHIHIQSETLNSASNGFSTSYTVDSYDDVGFSWYSGINSEIGGSVSISLPNAPSSGARITFIFRMLRKRYNSSYSVGVGFTGSIVNGNTSCTFTNTSALYYMFIALASNSQWYIKQLV